MVRENELVNLKSFLASQTSTEIEKESPWLNKELGMLPEILSLQAELYAMPTASSLTSHKTWKNLGAEQANLTTSDQNYDEVFKNLALEILKTWPFKKATLEEKAGRRLNAEGIKREIQTGDREFELAEQYLGVYREICQKAKELKVDVSDFFVLNMVEEQKALFRVISRNLDTPLITLIMKEIMTKYVNIDTSPLNLHSFDYVKRLPSRGERLFNTLITALYKACFELRIKDTSGASLEKLKSKFVLATETNTYSEL